MVETTPLTGETDTSGDAAITPQVARREIVEETQKRWWSSMFDELVLEEEPQWFDDSETGLVDRIDHMASSGT